MTTRTGVSAPRPLTATLALVALAITLASAMLLDAVAPGAGPLVQPLSSFAHTPYAWLWRETVGAGACAVLLLALAMRHQAPRLFTMLLAAAGAGLAATGLWIADLWFPWERTPTVSGTAHSVGVLLVIGAFSAAMLVRARSLPASSTRAACRACEVAYLVSGASALLYIIAMAMTKRPPLLFGLWERLLLGSALAWCAALAVGTPDRAPRRWFARRSLLPPSVR